MDFKKICINCMKEKPTVGGFCPNCGFKNEDYQVPVNELPPLTPLNGKYLLGKSLGSGGFGITYLALDTQLQVVVAIKELFLKKISIRDSDSTISVSSKDKACFEENKKRFLQEARVLAMFNEKENEGVVIVKEYFEEKNTAYIVMEYLDGETLKEKVKRKPLSFEETRDLMEPVCHALMKIHQFKVVHLDVTPDNIMLLGDHRAKLLDFGGSKTIGSQDKSNQYSFKKGYAPLEQRKENGKIGEWTDVFSTAATMYYCMTGNKPVDVNDRLAGKELKRPSELGLTIPQNSEDAMMRALELDPDNRFRTMEEFWAEFNAVPKKDKKKAIRIIAVAAVILAVIIGIFGFGNSSDDGKASTSLEETEIGTDTEKPVDFVSTEEEVAEKPELGETIMVDLGTYILENAADRNYIMGIAGGFGDDGTPLVLKDYEDSNKNRLFVTDEDPNDGFYNLRAAHTNSFIETTESQELGETVRQFAEISNAGTEKWCFVYCGHDDEKDMDEVILINAAGSVLAPKDGLVENGTELVLADYNMDDEKQKWYMRWSEKDDSEDDVAVYHEGDLVEDISGIHNISSALDGMTSFCISRDTAFHPEPTVVVFHSEWLTDEDTSFGFEFVPTGFESRYKIFPTDQLENEHKCLEYNPDTNELVMRDESDNENQLFRLVYVHSNTYLIQTYNESVVGFDLDEQGQAVGVAVMSRPYDAVADSRLVSWLIVAPHEEN